MPLMRSLLLLPTNDADVAAKAHAGAADVFVLDLVAEQGGRSSLGRDAVPQIIAALKEEGRMVFVRLGGAPDAVHEDLALCVAPGLAGLILASVEAAAQIRGFDVHLREQEMRKDVRPGTVMLFPEIASARGVLRCEDILLASTRIAGLVLDDEAFCRHLGVSWSREALEHARRIVVTACVGYGLSALDGAEVAGIDPGRLQDEASYARSLGFKGKLARDERQAEVCNEVFGAEAQ